MKQKHKNTATTVIRNSCWLPLVAIAAMLAGCTKAETPQVSDDGNDTPVAFTASLPAALPQAEADNAKTPATRTATGADGNTVWTPGDAVGIFMLTPRTFSPAGILPGGENARYTVDPATGKLTADGAPMHYPREGAVDFRAYYPHGTKGAGNITDDYTYHISVADQSDPASLDLLQADAFNVENSTGEVSLNFRHVLAKIKFDITLGEGLSGLDAGKITAATITGMPTTAKFALLSSFFSQAGNPADIAALQEPTPSSGADATFTALVVPHAAPSGTGLFSDRHIVVTVDGVEYTGDIPYNDGIPGGRLYTYPVTVSRRGVTLGAAAITPWTTSDHATGEARPVSVEVVKITAGTFFMGSPDSDPDADAREKPRHQVTLTRDFYMGKYEVTAVQYAEFLNAMKISNVAVDNYFRGNVNGYGERPLFYESGKSPRWNTATARWEATGKMPMTSVTWYGAQAFAEWAGGRLPTTTEWEYACRAGTDTKFSYGDNANGEYMWYKDNSNGQIHEVGTRKPNPWGLYDMHGNALEWCLDVLLYTSGPTTDPIGIVGFPGGNYELRGGDYAYIASNCRSATRIAGVPDKGGSSSGFRVVFPL